MPPFPASATSDHINTSYHYSLPTSTPYRNPSLHHMPAHSSSSTFPPFSAAAAPSTPSTTPGAQHSVPDSAPGTTENPLIPKRRRRTTPAELAILETEFRVNPRPDPQERARIAGRLGMTIRAVQVWLQNRRQKEKKESSSYSGVGGLSSPASSIASGECDVSFSSSPMPSPGLPLFPTTANPSVIANPFKALPPLVGSSSASGFSSSANKENILPSSNLASFSTIPAYHYSYPSQSTPSQHAPTTTASAAPPSSTAGSSTIPAVFMHRPHNSSMIAAKKHVRKRPLGSHAPLARTPSLPHAFDFPPSPPKPSRSASFSSSVASRPAPAARTASLGDVFARATEQPHSRSVTTSTISSSGLFAHTRGETVSSASAQRRRSSTPMSAVFPSAVVEEDAAVDIVDDIVEEDVLPSCLPALTPASRARVKDDLLRHMESDPPSASSPQPLTWRRMAAHDAALSGRLDSFSDEDEDEETTAAQHGSTVAPGTFQPSSHFTATRPLLPARTLSTASAPATSSLHFSRLAPNPTLLPRANSVAPISHPLAAHSLSLPSRPSPFGPLPSSSIPSLASLAAQTPSTSLDASIARASAHARAPGTGGENAACAIAALGRKRARILETAPASKVVNVNANTVSVAIAKPIRIRTAPKIFTVAKKEAKVKVPAKKRRRISAAFVSAEDDADTEGQADESYLADLSFSSTSTASTVDSLVTVADSTPPNGGYFALGSAVAAAAAAAQQADGAKQSDDERECAELLLGLGGFL